jgi:acetyl esterase/lipase
VPIPSTIVLLMTQRGQSSFAIPASHGGGAITILEGTTTISLGSELPLWPAGAPGSEGTADRGPEIVAPLSMDQRVIAVSNIHNPSILVYLVPRDSATGAAMIVAPGGGHRFLSINTEGTNVAEYLNSIGVSAFVLKYRLGREPGSPYQAEVHALQDVQRAIRLVRSRAEEWRIDRARVGVMGFSAGAHVAVMAATRYDAGQADNPDPIERQASRPDFQALIYGGAWPETPTFNSDTPPTFLLGTDDDLLIPSSTMANLYLALKEEDVPAELHLYATGGHGFGLRHPPGPHPSMASWQHRLGDWLGDRGLLAKE